MTYKEKFAASEHRAHYQNIATKIHREMTDLRAKVENSNTTARRWVWELIQNAKDVYNDDGVQIKIELKKNIQNPFLYFKHTGKPFTADNIRFLIEQISSKERTKDETGKSKSTGKFGTGFLTTHMLSEIVIVNGVAKEDGLKHRQFKLVLDRSGYELNDIIDAVEISKESVSNLDELPAFENYNKNDYNTTFLYRLSDALSLKVADEGLIDLKNCLPYALTFVDEIKSVETVHDATIYHKLTSEFSDDLEIEFVRIQKEDLLDEINYTIAKLSNGFTSIAIPVEIDNGKVKILPIKFDVPKFFCDFPLIGTEDFPFPVIINNPNFNPTDPRDGVYLTDSTRGNTPILENKAIISEAIELYYSLLKHAAENEWDNLHLLANINSLRTVPYWISESWFNDNLLNPIRKKLLRACIVKTANGKLASILNEKNEHYTWFPSSSTKEVREKVWELANDWFPHCLPAKENIELWNRLAWKECGKLTLDQFSAFVESTGEISKLESNVSDTNVFTWLNSFYELLKLDEKEYHTIIDKRTLIPDQNGDLSKRSQLSKDEGDIEDTFKDILKAFGNDIRSKLADENIDLDFDNRVIDQGQVVRDITTLVTEKTSDREVAKSYRSAFNKILIYFKEFPNESKDLFPWMYKNKHLLYDDDEILENISKAEQLDELLKEFNVTNADDLRAMLENTSSTGSLLPITEEIILSMGISSIDEWQKALEDKDLKVLFSHDSVPSHEMFVYAQSHIRNAIKSVLEHLEKLDDYDLSNMEQTATTIFSGIIKHGQEISIVVRPAYNSEVIIYYGSERDVLDYEPSELWIDDGIEIKQITLGHILKTAQIRKFPV